MIVAALGAAIGGATWWTIHQGSHPAPPAPTPTPSRNAPPPPPAPAPSPTPAKTSEADDVFILLLARFGMNIRDVDNQQLAIRDAHWVCGLFEQGQTQTQVVTAEQQRASLNDEGGKDFVASAVTAYCPQYIPPSDRVNPTGTPRPETP